MDFTLSPVEARVLGALIEKDLATPEYYPLSLNALTNACNQKTNREPVTSYDDATVRDALTGLRELRLAVFVSEAGSRVEKYRHRLSETFNFTRGELALLAVMLLRGPQTLGELKDRTHRMYGGFQDLEAVENALRKLAAREPDPLVKQLPRAAGTKEPRWAHLLAGEPEMPAVVEAGGTGMLGPSERERISQLEEEVAALRAEMNDLRGYVERLRQLLD